MKACRHLRTARGAFLCGRTLTVISPDACVACPHRENLGETKTLDLAQHPHAVHGAGERWDAEVLLRVARNPPGATRPYK